MRVLVTGADGFVGNYLCARLLDEGHEVLPTALRGSATWEPWRPDGDEGRGRVSCRLETLELPDGDRARELVAQFHPDIIVHLAAVSSVPFAEQNPELTCQINVEGTRALLEAAPYTRFLYISSCVVYGSTPIDEQPVSEVTDTRPVGVYGQSKLDAEAQVNELGGDRSVILRPFNHFGPGQTDSFVLSSFASQVAAIERGEKEPVLRVGNLEVRRDFLDVRDVVDAYLRVVEQPGLSGIFNLASGQGYRLRDLVETLREASQVDFEVTVDPRRLRKNDLEILTGDATRFQETTGWEPKIPMDQTLTDLLDYWRQNALSSR